MTLDADRDAMLASLGRLTVALETIPSGCARAPDVEIDGSGTLVSELAPGGLVVTLGVSDLVIIARGKLVLVTTREDVRTRPNEIMRTIDSAIARGGDQRRIG